MNNRSLVAWLLFAAAAVPAGARPRPLDERLRSVVEYWCSEPRECYAPYHELLKYKRHEVAASGDYVYVYGIVKDGESPYPPPRKANRVHKLRRRRKVEDNPMSGGSLRRIYPAVVRQARTRGEEGGATPKKDRS